MVHLQENVCISVLSTTQRPNALGRFGRFGGKFVPETLMCALSNLETAFRQCQSDPVFQYELQTLHRDYAGRPSPLYFAERMTARYAKPDGTGPQIYLKREDLNHTGSHKINSALAQVLLAKKIGKQRIVCETGDGQHGFATAAVCARFGMQCVVYMGVRDIERQTLNVFRMKLMGAEVRPVEAKEGMLREAISEAFRDCVTNLETSYYLIGSAIGPHPYPMMVREFQAAIGRETRTQCQEKWGGLPDILLACVGGGSNAVGLFHEFIDEPTVRLIGVEAAGLGLDSEQHAATLTRGRIGVFHGAMSYLLQDMEGQVVEPHSISAGLNYPSVGPELSYLKDIGRVEYDSVGDQQALEAFQRLSQLEGIIPALETAHAIAYLETLCPQLSGSPRIVINCSGRGDKDVLTVAKNLFA